MPDNLKFNINLNVFVTNDDPLIDKSINGLLGISPCPSKLSNNKYSFARQLVDYYKSEEVGLIKNQ